MSKDDQYRWTEGVFVHRVGCSSEVSADYRLPANLIQDAESQARRKAERVRVREFLRAKGYPLNETGWVVCKGE
jgi:hypothetical protein